MVVFNSINLEHRNKIKNIEKLKHIHQLEKTIKQLFGVKNFATIKYLDLYEEFNHHNIIKEVISNGRYGSELYNIREEFKKMLDFIRE